MKKVLNKIREFVWPLLEADSMECSDPCDTPIVISPDNLEEAFKLNSEICKNEEDRRKSIESKASLFLSTISVATSIVVAANALIISNRIYGLPIKILVFISFILSVYAVRTVWFSIKALERGSYSVLDFVDINIPGDKPTYYSEVIKKTISISKSNHSIINKKVDFFTMAQEYYKRAVCTICIYSFFILMFCLF